MWLLNCVYNYFTDTKASEQHSLPTQDCVMIIAKLYQTSCVAQTLSIKKFFFAIDYIKELIEKVVELVENITDSCDSKPPSLSRNYNYPNKLEAITAHKSRFAHL